MALQEIIKNLDTDFYLEARKKGMNAVQAFADHASEAGYGPEPEVLNSREEHYIKSFEVKDPLSSHARLIKQHAYDTWAMEKAFAEAGLPFASHADFTLEKAFSLGANVQSLFPIFYENRIVQSILATPVLGMIVGETVTVNEGTIDHVVLNETQAQRSTGQIGEFTVFPEMTVSATNAQVVIKEFGSILKISDQAAKRVRLPILSNFLDRAGQQIVQDLVDFAIDVAFLGDGAAGAATTVTAVGSPPTYADWISLLFDVPNGYKLNTLITPKAGIVDMLNTAEFKDPLSGFLFQRTGELPKPFGLDWARWDTTTTISSAWKTPGTAVLALQRERALVQYNDGPIRTETDRIINGRWQETATSLGVAFAILDSQARRKGAGYAV
jgi:hypothetical protein